jgi:hypothetical protein
MLTIARLFGKSPFAPLQTHMDKVSACVGQLPTLFDAWLKGEAALAIQIAEKILELEKEADLTKEGIRTHLPKSLFLPVDRTALFDILSLQEQIAGLAEAIAHHAMIPDMRLSVSLQSGFSLLPQRNLETFWRAQQVVRELDGLLESSFGGLEAEKVKGMIDHIAFLEQEACEEFRVFVKALYAAAPALPYQTFHWTFRLIEKIGCLSRLSKQLGNRIRLLLELK